MRPLILFGVIALAVAVGVAVAPHILPIVGWSLLAVLGVGAVVGVVAGARRFEVYMGGVEQRWIARHPRLQAVRLRSHKIVFWLWCAIIAAGILSILIHPE